jgi:hypothetical protein
MLQLLAELDSGQLALPDFQRTFVWAPDETRELLVSMIRSFPVGNLLFLQGSDATFRARAAEGAPPLMGRPSHLVLDGQQRLTSLYQAIYGVGDSRFFLDLGALLAGADVDQAVKMFSADRATPLKDIEAQARTLLMLLTAVRGFGAGRWRDDVVPRRDDKDRERVRELLRDVENACIDPLVVEPDDWCHACGCLGVPRDSVLRRLAHVPLGWRATILHVRIRRYRCSGCGQVWRQDTTAAAAPRAKLSTQAVMWALKSVVIDRMSIARIAAGLGVSWHTVNDAVLATGHQLLIADPTRFYGVQVLGMDEHNRAGHGVIAGEPRAGKLARGFGPGVAGKGPAFGGHLASGLPVCRWRVSGRCPLQR